ncbi:M20/M25/M40 family metallo-hydrolase [bacterium]|nr:M20/M25/M40 family metallo-hydrolase [bacterium]
MKQSFIFIGLLASQQVFSHIPDFSAHQTQAVYADLNLLKQARIPVLYADNQTNIGYSVLTPTMLQKLSELSHQHGRCGNFEALSQIPNDINIVKKDLDAVNKQHKKDLSYMSVARNLTVAQNPKIAEALQELKADNIKQTVTWLSSYHSRYNKGANANVHVNDFYEKMKLMTANSSFPVTVDLISHRSTPQKSVRVSIKGSTKPDEYVIFGAHYDSISGWGGTGRAPGADDNASGSASLLEAMRVALTKEQPQRTLEFMWYAGEESGLLGSAEIAEAYKVEKRNVIAVLQLDMTMFPGDGEFKITSITDFTSPWLRDYMKALNTTYLNIEILDDKCGYGCSDHASWNRRGFPAVFPTEAKFNSMFQYIHTDKDVISSVMSFEHSLVFSKIALAMALDLGNSTQREALH